jgi:hypothetical protein
MKNNLIILIICILVSGCDKFSSTPETDKADSSMVDSQLEMAKRELDDKNYGKTVEITIKISEAHPKNFKANYLHAQAAGMTGNVKDALDQLEQALRSGFKDFDELKKNKNLDAIKTNPKYKLILQKYDPNFSNVSIEETEIDDNEVSIKNIDGKQVVKAGDVSVTLPND